MRDVVSTNLSIDLIYCYRRCLHRFRYGQGRGSGSIGRDSGLNGADREKMLISDTENIHKVTVLQNYISHP